MWFKKNWVGKVASKDTPDIDYIWKKKSVFVKQNRKEWHKWGGYILQITLLCSKSLGLHYKQDTIFPSTADWTFRQPFPPIFPTWNIRIFCVCMLHSLTSSLPTLNTHCTPDFPIRGIPLSLAIFKVLFFLFPNEVTVCFSLLACLKKNNKCCHFHILFSKCGNYETKPDCD